MEIASVCAALVALAGALLLRAVRHQSLALSVVVVALVGVGAVVAGALGTAKAMFLSPHDFSVLLLVTAVSGTVALLSALALGRGLVRRGKDLANAAGLLGTGDYVPGRSGPAARAGAGRRRPDRRRRAAGCGTCPRALAVREPAAARRRDEPRPAYAAGGDPGDGRGARGRRRHRTGRRSPLPPGPAPRGRPDDRHGRGPVRGRPHRRAQPAAGPASAGRRRARLGRPGLRLAGRAHPRRAARREPRRRCPGCAARSPSSAGC